MHQAAQGKSKRQKKPLRREAGRAELKMLEVAAAMFAACQ
jgi:hypothetical protein